MGEESFESRLAAVCHEAFGEGELQRLARLSGGANMESWALDWGAERLVLRRLPGGASSEQPADSNLGAIGLDEQAALIEVARRAGVSAPAVRARLEPRHGLGTGFVMARVEGETLAHRILGNPAFARAEANLVRQCARELARIHALDPAVLPGELRYHTPLQAVREQERHYRELGAALPVFDLAFGWLARNAPDETAPAVLHGDFRMGNLMIDAVGIAAVLDWELAHLGDPAQDLAYLCTPSWRFGRYEQPVGGFGRVDDLLAAYAEESGRAIEPRRFGWWLVYSTLWWGMVCLAMGQMWRTGSDRSLERAVIGRRVSEVEIDLLLLFEDELGLRARPRLRWAAPTGQATSGEIGRDELLAAVDEWIKGSVQAGASGHALFEARVAGNAIGIARRGAAWGEHFTRAAAARLAALGLDEHAFCAALREGLLDPGEPRVRDHLRLRALERISVDQPGYAGLGRARERWLLAHDTSNVSG